MAPVSTQPLSNFMNAYSIEDRDDTFSNQCQIHLDSKGRCACAADASPAGHRACHKARLWKLLLPVLFLLLAAGAALAISCVFDVALLEIVGLGADMGGNPLAKRSTNGQSTFASHKLYLIIIFVGLFLVVIAGIMLSFCCCKDSFRNPLCCPCYLCACCGGLACLECIGCGLCAAGLEMA